MDPQPHVPPEITPELDPDAEFLKQWTPETAPACPEGLRLLLDLAKRYPPIYAMVERKGFVDAPTAYLKNPAWKAFSDHYASCQDCNEA